MAQTYHSRCSVDLLKHSWLLSGWHQLWGSSLFGRYQLWNRRSGISFGGDRCSGGINFGGVAVSPLEEAVVRVVSTLGKAAVRGINFGRSVPSSSFIAESEPERSVPTSSFIYQIRTGKKL